jgi:hypothetical protein
MAGPLILIVLVCLINIPIITSYTTLNRILSQLGKFEFVNILLYYNDIFIDNQRLSINKTLIYSSTLDDCISVQAVKQLGCSFGEKDSLFKSICEQHQLCYACVSYRNK